MSKKKSSDDFSDDFAEDEVGAQAPVDASESVQPEKPEPPPEAEPHEGVAPYTLVADANIKHQDYKAGDTIPLTYDEYQTLRASDVHCTPNPSPSVGG